jgi:hypothetical protein
VRGSGKPQKPSVRIADLCVENENRRANRSKASLCSLKWKGNFIRISEVLKRGVAVYFKVVRIQRNNEILE